MTIYIDLAELIEQVLSQPQVADDEEGQTLLERWLECAPDEPIVEVDSDVLIGPWELLARCA